MNRIAIISLAVVAAFVVIPLTLYFYLPSPTPPANAPPQSERDSVRDLVLGSADEVPHVTYTKVRTTDRRVVVVEARWAGEGEPDRKDQEGWNAEADKIAKVIAEQYLPSGWQVNVLLFRTRILLMGVGARPSALDGPEGWLRMAPEA